MTKNFNIAIIITAAGSSTRMGGNIKKEYLPLKNGTVLSNCAVAFLNAIKKLENCTISDFIVTYPQGTGSLINTENLEKSQQAFFADAAVKQNLNGLEVQFVPGSKTRQASVFNALKAVQKNHFDPLVSNCNAQNKNSSPDVVLIHDGARPFVTEKIILEVIQAALENGASVPGITPTDTQKEIDQNGFIVRHLERRSLAAVQTPQGFNFEKLFEAHQKAALEQKEYTDDTEIWGKYCGKVKVVPGDIVNKKITYPGDL